MAKALIIVESPAKTKTLKNFLGNDYRIEASMGHVRDLPKERLSVDVENDFAPTYQSIPERKEVLRKLTAAVKDVETVYLASDPDREGEAIAWHLAEALHLKNARRIEFNEITRQAVQQALQHSRAVNMDRVNAQQARRVLDRLIGYKLSPVLSSKIQKGATAGRVQSVAVRLICEREREILAFVPEEYWSLTATLTPQPPEKRFLFPAKLWSRAGQRLEPKSQDEMDVILSDLDGARYAVAEVKRREQTRNPSAPFITSTLQQEASRKLHMSNKNTMRVAQSLYEGVELGPQGSVGLITYMRTDSVRVAAEAQTEARKYISEKYGANYMPKTPKQYKTKGAAQDAHEAIRPTSAFREPDAIAQYLKPDELKLYRLIWQRFVASQMSPALLDVTTADIAATTGIGYRVSGVGEKPMQGTGVRSQVSGDGKNPIPDTRHPIPDAQRPTPNAPYIFRATGSVMKFDGFMRVYTEGKDTNEVADDEQPPLPPLAKDQNLDLIKLEPRQHFTEPPPRYNEATIVKALEEQGIGRPSTYAAIISTIQDRGYAELQDKRFYPTELGFTVTDQLVKHFPTVMDVKFTADMETKLDDVEEGKANWVNLLRNFYDPFAKLVETAKVEMERLKPAPVETEYRCPATGNVMFLRQSKYGAFLGCSGYPKCKKVLKVNEDGTPVEGPNFTCGLEAKPEKTAVDPATLPNATEHVCPEGRGRMLQRMGRMGPFLGCSEYPKCRTLLNINKDGTLKEGQSFQCTYSEENGNTKKNGAKKTPTARSTTTKRPAAKPKATAVRKAKPKEG